MSVGPAAAGTVEIGPIEAEHFERWHDIRRQAFGGTDVFDPAIYHGIPADRVLGAFVDGVLSASTVTHPYRQTWAGAGIPCGGVSGVVVAPEARGRGLARRLIGAQLSEMAERGEVIAALYPTTASLYRSLGFEVAGSYTTRSIPGHTILIKKDDDVTWDRVEFDDSRIIELEAAAARARAGWLSRDRASWDRMATRWRGEPAVNRYAYVGRRDGTDVAAVVYHYAEPEDPEFGVFYAIETDVIAATDPDAWRSAFGLLAMQSTTSAEIRTDLPETALIPLLTHPQRARVRGSIPWMLRLVDVAAAVAARPVSSAVTGSASFTIDDNAIEANAGPWTLTVEDGRARLSEGGPGTATVSVQTLARIYAGVDATSIANAGGLPGATASDLDLLSATFAGTPELQFFF